MKVYLVGRAKDCDINVADPTVSRCHAELIVQTDTEFLLVDKQSTSGTFVLRKGEWRPVSTARVGPQDKVRLGAFETTVGDLVETRTKRTTPGRLERDPETGEIVDRRTDRTPT
jgi:pSer/pThr/pTyr-binding forkhead associated (FHA) protein